MSRPKSDDPKEAVTLRIRRSVVDRYEALGEGWRGAMEAVVESNGPAPDRLSNEPMRSERSTGGNALSFGKPGPIHLPKAAYGSRLKKR